MGELRRFYESRIFPWLNDRFCTDPQLTRLRSEALAAARGRVAEIGFGTGLNLPHYPEGVESVTAIEPNPGMRERAAARIAASRIPVQWVAGPAESLPLPDGAFDTAVSVLTLCSVNDPARVLRELRRVLRDGGRLLVLEHGRSPETGVARWQDRLNGVQNVLAAGCNLNRPAAETVRGEGFRFEELRQFYVPKLPRTHGWITLGTAVKD